MNSNLISAVKVDRPFRGRWQLPAAQPPRFSTANFRLILILVTAVLLQGVCRAGDTAYQALRVLGRERTSALLNRVIQVEGREGAPQPGVWKVVLDDPAARGGVREFEVQNGKVSSERTPVHAYSGTAAEAVMDFKKLNLDSAGAFTIANKEAAAARVGFDTVDYVLRCGDNAGAPVWILKLTDDKRQVVGTIQISADSGAVVSRVGFGTGVRHDGPATENPDAVQDNTRRDTMGHKIKQSFINAGASMEEFFTGRRTLDRTHADQDPPVDQGRGD